MSKNLAKLKKLNDKVGAKASNKKLEKGGGASGDIISAAADAGKGILKKEMDERQKESWFYFDALENLQETDNTELSDQRVQVDAGHEFYWVSLLWEMNEERETFPTKKIQDEADALLDKSRAETMKEFFKKYPAAKKALGDKPSWEDVERRVARERETDDEWKEFDDLYNIMRDVCDDVAHFGIGFNIYKKGSNPRADKKGNTCVVYAYCTLDQKGIDIPSSNMFEEKFVFNTYEEFEEKFSSAAYYATAWLRGSDWYKKGGSVKRTKRAIDADKRIKALKPGRRVSEAGNVYYENRPNRSDMDRKKKFAKGGKVKRTKRAIDADKRIKALKPGRRVSEAGNVYYENRPNRSDESRVKKLARGGAASDFDIDEILLHYKIAALWSSTDEEGTPLDSNWDVNDISQEASSSMRADVERFVTENKELLKTSELTEEEIGHDFWLTRSGHGAGFWDKGWDDVFEKLSDAARKFGESNLLVDGDEIAVFPMKAAAGMALNTMDVPDELAEFARGGQPKIANVESRAYTENLLPFKGANLEGKILDNGNYVVLSYGYYPIWFYNKAEGRWYGNKDKYSVTTAKHISQTRPTTEATILSHQELIDKMNDEAKYDLGGLMIRDMHPMSVDNTLGAHAGTPLEAQNVV